MTGLFILLALISFLGIAMVTALVLCRPNPFTILRTLFQIIGFISVIAMPIPLVRCITSIHTKEAFNQADVTLLAISVGTFVLCCVLIHVFMYLDKRFYGSFEEKEQS